MISCHIYIPVIRGRENRSKIISKVVSKKVECTGDCPVTGLLYLSGQEIISKAYWIRVFFSWRFCDLYFRIKKFLPINCTIPALFRQLDRFQKIPDSLQRYICVLWISIKSRYENRLICFEIICFGYNMVINLRWTLLEYNKNKTVTNLTPN